MMWQSYWDQPHVIMPTLRCVSGCARACIAPEEHAENNESCKTPFVVSTGESWTNPVCSEFYWGRAPSADCSGGLSQPSHGEFLPDESPPIFIFFCMLTAFSSPLRTTSRHWLGCVMTAWRGSFTWFSSLLSPLWCFPLSCAVCHTPGPTRGNTDWCHTFLTHTSHQCGVAQLNPLLKTEICV